MYVFSGNTFLGKAQQLIIALIRVTALSRYCVLLYLYHCITKYLQFTLKRSYF